MRVIHSISPSWTFNFLFLQLGDRNPCSGGSTKTRFGRFPPPRQVFFIFIQFLWTFDRIITWIAAPLYNWRTPCLYTGKTWIRHCLELVLQTSQIQFVVLWNGKKYFKLVAFRIFSDTELPTFPKQKLSVKRQSLPVLVNSIKHLYFEAIDKGGCSLYSLWSCQKLLNQDVWHFQKALGKNRNSEYYLRAAKHPN